jgi:hypothetical protein
LRPEWSRLKDQETVFYDVGYLETLDATPSDTLADRSKISRTKRA